MELATQNHTTEHLRSLSMPHELCYVAGTPYTLVRFKRDGDAFQSGYIKQWTDGTLETSHESDDHAGLVSAFALADAPFVPNLICLRYPRESAKL